MNKYHETYSRFGKVPLHPIEWKIFIFIISFKFIDWSLINHSEYSGFILSLLLSFPCPYFLNDNGPPPPPGLIRVTQNWWRVLWSEFKHFLNNNAATLLRNLASRHVYLLFVLSLFIYFSLMWWKPRFLFSRVMFSRSNFVCNCNCKCFSLL